MRLYHRVPEPMLGRVLYPLNRLAALHPEAARQARLKYEGRENLMAVRLPVLDCLWNDVLHLSPLHPSKIKECLAACGLPPPPPRRFFAIEAETLARSRAVYFRHSRDTAGRYDFLESDFSPFDAARYRELDAVPEEQRLYFLRMKRDGGRPLLWARTPHVFYRGEIEIEGLEQIEW